MSTVAQITKGKEEEFIEITEKYNSKGFLVERYYMKDGEKIDLPIPKFLQENPVVAFWNPNIDYVKTTKKYAPEELDKKIRELKEEEDDGWRVKSKSSPQEFMKLASEVGKTFTDEEIEIIKKRRNG